MKMKKNIYKLRLTNE